VWSSTAGIYTEVAGLSVQKHTVLSWVLVKMCLMHFLCRDRWVSFVIMIMNLRIPEKVENFLTSERTVSFTGRNVLHRVSWLVTQSIVYYSE
jgi:hypothetical protein